MQFWHPNFTKCIQNLESVQKRATGMTCGLENQTETKEV